MFTPEHDMHNRYLDNIFKWRSVNSFKKWIANITLFMITYKKRCSSLKPCFYRHVIVKKSNPF